jgi:diguanylate cyclase (GGDEF)-like protein/PAS domain S-box-containing protein
MALPSKHHITLLEEDHPLRTGDVQALQALGYEVTTAGSPAEILPPAPPPEIIVIAVNPGCGKRQAAAAAALQQAADTPLILLIDDGATAELTEFETLIHAGFVPRSANPLFLKNALAIALKRARYRRVLQESEKHLREALQGSHTGAWEWDIAAGAYHFSPDFGAGFGYTAVEFDDCLACAEALIHPDDMPAASAAMDAHLRGDSPDYHSEHRLRCKDGTYRWVLACGGVVERGAAGAPLRAAGTLIDITRRKEEEFELGRWERIFEHARWGVAVSSQDGAAFAMLNPAFASMHGFTVVELSGTPILDIFTPDCREDALGHLRATSPQDNITFDSWHLRKDGSRFPVQIHISVLRDSAGVFQYRIVNVQDISGQVARENALRELKERFQEVLENSLDAAYKRNLRTNAYEYMSPVIARITGYTAQEMIDLPMDAVLAAIHPDDLPSLQSNLAASLGGEPGTANQVEYRFRRKNGGHVWLQDRYVVTRAAGQPTALIGSVSDITLRKQAEMDLLARERRIRLLYESSMDGILFSHPDGRIFDANPAACRMLGKTREEIVSGGRAGMINTADPRLLPALQERERTGYFQGELTFLRRDGTPFPVELTSTTDTSAGGNRQTHIIFRDISERIRSEAVLRESEERYRSLFEHMQEGFSLHEIITDPSGNPVDFRFLDANPAYERHTGFKREGSIGRTMLEIQPNADHHQIARYGRVAQTGEPLTFEYYSKAYNRHLRVHAFSPRPGQFATIFEDISAFRKTESALRESEERFLNMADTAPVLIWMAGTDGLCYYFNATWLAYTGRSLAQEIGMGWVAGVHPADRERCLSAYLAAFQGHCEFEMEYRLRRANGAYGVVVDHAVPRFTPAGEFLGFIGSCTDITERADAEKQLREYSDILSLALKIANLAYWDCDLAAGEFIFNDRFYALYGTSAEREGGYRLLVSVYAQRFIHPGDREQVAAQAVLTPTGERNPHFAPYLEHRTLLPGGEVRWIAVTTEAEFDPSGRLVSLHGVNQDITARRQTDEQVRLQANLLSEVKQAVIATDLDGRYIYWNPFAENLFGYHLADVLGKISPTMRPTPALETQTHTIRQNALEHQVWKTEIEARSSRGDQLVLETTTSIMYDQHGSPTGYIGIMDEISERKREQEAIQRANEELIRQLDLIEQLQVELREQALHDALTGLYNRRYFADALNQEILRAERENSPLSVIISDIDHFKIINDNYGHQAGDLVLVELADLLKKSVRGFDFICRYGGEEFLLVLPHTSNDAALKRAEEIRQKCAAISLPWQEHLLGVTLSLGVATFPEDGQDADQITARADQALYHSKQSGRNRATGWRRGQHIPASE